MLRTLTAWKVHAKRISLEDRAKAFIMLQESESLELSRGSRLVGNFAMIESQAERGAPKAMEWYASLGLMVAIVWIYFEILRLLMKLNRRR